MQPLVISEPICQLKHLNLKLCVGNHPFHRSVFVRDTKVLLAAGAAALRLTPDLTESR